MSLFQVAIKMESSECILFCLVEWFSSKLQCDYAFVF
jgi:hypothetical protein